MWCGERAMANCNLTERWFQRREVQGLVELTERTYVLIDEIGKGSDLGMM